MKKVLFATTALIATAGMAAADVKLSGYGRFGIIYNEGATYGRDGLAGTADDVAADDTSITSRFRLNIDGTTTADNGVTFGARVRMEGDSNAAGFTASPTLRAARFYAMSSGLTVAAGNILGAIDSMPYLYHGSVGLTGLGYVNVVSDYGADDFYSVGAARTGMEVIYEADMYSVHASYSDPVTGAVGSQSRAAIAASANFSGYTIALGYQDSEYGPDVEFVAIVAGEVGPATVSLAYAQDHAGNDQYNLAVSADVAAATEIQAYYNYDEGAVTLTGVALDEDSYGVGFTHDIGGGASLRGGVASLNGTTRADLGVLFNF
ncbi:porin [Pseudooceanicola nanhaiensis]|uniref:porin n=1 Tax=Pseudooceanicola nanhaiensis TaxID=375761 RepID=UPI0035121247